MEEFYMRFKQVVTGEWMNGMLECEYEHYIMELKSRSNSQRLEFIFDILGKEYKMKDQIKEYKKMSTHYLDYYELDHPIPVQGMTPLRKFLSNKNINPKGHIFIFEKCIDLMIREKRSNKDIYKVLYPLLTMVVDKPDLLLEPINVLEEELHFLQVYHLMSYDSKLPQSAKDEIWKLATT